MSQLRSTTPEDTEVEFSRWTMQIGSLAFLKESGSKISRLVEIIGVILRPGHEDQLVGWEIGTRTQVGYIPQDPHLSRFWISEIADIEIVRTVPDHVIEYKGKRYYV